MLAKNIVAFATLMASAAAQQVCNLTPESHPSLSWKRCTGSGCNNVNGQVTIDSNWRWTHELNSATNCYDGNTWNSVCRNSGVDCAAKCCLEGADYAGTYGVQATGDALNIKFVTNGPYSKNIGSRMYLMADENKYQMFQLLGNEFTFDVDVSNLGCGLNGALYFVSMDEDGGRARYSGNKAGAKYGTGYCDAQCARDLKFINGKANSEGWEPSSTDSNAGLGQQGSCCAEMDIWEANKMASAFTPHPCTTNAQHACNADTCGGTYSSDRYSGTCDADGCDFNAYRQGDQSFYGPGKIVDTNRKMTVVTQFLTGSNGKLSEIRRLYVQDGVIYENADSLIPGNPGDSITEQYCQSQKTAFGDRNDFATKGGLAKMGDALQSGMVLVMSLWADNYAHMLWLDSTYPVDSTAYGASRGPCPTTGGDPKDVQNAAPNSNVIFSNIKFGPIGSTYQGSSGPNPQPSSSTVRPSSTSVRPSSTSTRTTSTSTRSTSTAPPTPTGGPGAARWGQCGGINWNGPKTCQAPWTCQYLNDWYYQCL